MQFLCPNCQNKIELDQSSPDTIICSSCGSSFRLEEGSTGEWKPADGPRRLGKFELLQAVGVGGFGMVYKARDTDLGRIVAVKVPRAL
jgi:serine/threonine protein kinase